MLERFLPEYMKMTPQEKDNCLAEYLKQMDGEYDQVTEIKTQTEDGYFIVQPERGNEWGNKEIQAKNALKSDF